MAYGYLGSPVMSPPLSLSLLRLLLPMLADLLVGRLPPRDLATGIRPRGAARVDVRYWHH